MDDYYEGLALDRGPFDAGETPVPSMIAAAADNYFAESAFGQQRGHLWMRQQWTFAEPLQRDEDSWLRCTEAFAKIFERVM